MCSALSRNSTSRGTTFGSGISRQRQNFGAVGQVMRAMVVVWPSLWIVILLRSASDSGVSHEKQSPAPLNKEQVWPASVAWAA